MNKKILSLISISSLFLPVLAFAQTVRTITDAAVQSGLYIASGVVVLLWVMTGILFLSASGSPEKLTAGKKALFAAVAGTVLVIVASSAVSLVSNAFHI